MSYSVAHPSSRVMHFIRVPLALRRKSSSFTRMYYPARRCNRSCSTLSSGKPPVQKYIMNGLHQSEWISMTSGDSVMLSFGGGVSWDDSATLEAFAKAFEMLGSWSSYRKTPVRTIARLESSLANSSVSSFFLARCASTRDRRNYFLTCGAPDSKVVFCHPDMTTLCWPDWQWAVSLQEP
jgi:hypothetical protein